jgi:3-hydroxyisobutyrate dehydrogenase-like beta-hydroxyacid dehydrogenase
MKKIGFVGLGAMGKPMASVLLDAGYELSVFDVFADVVKEFESKGAIVMKSPAEVAKASDAVFTMLPDSPDVEAVYLEQDGLVAGASEGMYFIDCSTIYPEVTRNVGKALAAKGARMVDAPVGGGPAQAGGGNLIMLAGGDETDIEACRELLLTVGEKIIYAGPAGSGAALKLSNNLMTGLLVSLFAEGFSLAKESGVDINNLAELLKGNLPKVIPILIDKMINKDFTLGFKTKLIHKDMRLGLQMGQSNGVALPVGSLVKEMYQFNMNQGNAEIDLTSLIEVYEKNSH